MVKQVLWTWRCVSQMLTANMYTISETTIPEALGVVVGETCGIILLPLRMAVLTQGFKRARYGMHTRFLPRIL